MVFLLPDIVELVEVIGWIVNELPSIIENSTNLPSYKHLKIDMYVAGVKEGV